MKLKEFFAGRKKVRLGFIGGSITEGAGSSAREKRYSSMVTSGLAERYPETEFVEINAGFGGTTSACGLFRMKRDLLEHEPDVVFVEFAVNDTELESNGAFVENIIRNVKEYRRDIPVILLYTCTAKMYSDYGKGVFYESVTSQMKLCEYYSINQINIGYSLYEKGVDIDELLCDGVHPNDMGYEVYADVILEEMEKAELNFETVKRDFLYGRKLGGADMVLCSSLINGTWKLSDCDMFGKLPDYIWSENEGDEFSFEFSGKFLGMYYIIGKNSGIMEYSVDGREWKEHNCWDEYALSFDRPCFAILEEGLEDKAHVVKIRNSGRKHEQSTGTCIGIGAFAVLV